MLKIHLKSVITKYREKILLIADIKFYVKNKKNTDQDFYLNVKNELKTSKHVCKH